MGARANHPTPVHVGREECSARRQIIGPGNLATGVSSPGSKGVDPARCCRRLLRRLRKARRAKPVMGGVVSLARSPGVAMCGR